jgi:hypothetical protein
MPQIAGMHRSSRFETFDEQPIPGLNSEALDLRAASELFAPVRKLAPSAFRGLRVTNFLRNMVGPRGLEPQTSTVSICGSHDYRLLLKATK